MLAVGHHDYYYFNWLGTTLCLTIGDTENVTARRFLNGVPEHMFFQLANAIGETVWGANEYNVQNEPYMSFLSGQPATQGFMDRVSARTTFFSLMPFDLVCLSFVTFMPFHDIRSRWEIELDFGHTEQFHVNFNPHIPRPIQINENENENQLQPL